MILESEDLPMIGTNDHEELARYTTDMSILLIFLLWYGKFSNPLDSV